MGNALGGFTSNITSMATASKRKKQVHDKADAERDLLSYNKRIMTDQAQIALRKARLEAEHAELTAHIQKNQVNRGNKKLLEKQRVVQNKSGIEESGTAILVQQDQAMEMKLKENGILYQGYIKGYQALQQGDVQAWQFGQEATKIQHVMDVSRAKETYKKDAIDFQTKLTFAKMFYDPLNTTSFGEYDDPQQFQHTSLSSLAGGMMGGKSGGGQAQQAPQQHSLLSTGGGGGQGGSSFTSAGTSGNQGGGSFKINQ